MDINHRICGQNNLEYTKIKSLGKEYGLTEWTPSGEVRAEVRGDASSSDRESLAAQIIQLSLRKKQLQREIDDCRALIVAGAKKQNEVFELEDGASVRISWSKLSFSRAHRDNDFTTLPEDVTSRLSSKGVLEPCFKISLIEKNIESLSPERLKELEDQGIIRSRKVFREIDDKLSAIKDDLKEDLLSCGAIDLPEPKLRVLTTKPGRKGRWSRKSSQQN